MSLVDLYDKKVASSHVSVPIRLGPLPGKKELEAVTNALRQIGTIVKQNDEDYSSRKEPGLLRYLEIEIRI